MTFKLDENFGTRTLAIFRDFGHDVHTTRDEDLGGSNDTTILAACVREHRCLVTLDVDFANVLRFPPDRTAGIAVIRPGKNPSRELLSSLVKRLLLAVQAGSIDGRLWVVETGRIRVHAADSSDNRGVQNSQLPPSPFHPTLKA